MNRPATSAIVAVSTLAVLGLAARAAPESAASVATAMNEGLTWRQIIENGGRLMYVLLALSVAVVALAVYFAAVLRAGQVAPRSLHRELVDKIKNGAFDEARRACEYQKCPLSSISLAAMDYVREVPEAEASLVKDIMQGEGNRQAETIQGQTQYLLDIAAVAPMIGLLGTVFGMLRAFSSVALNIANAKPVVLAAGVSQALITTAFGLIVGIPAMMFYAYFRRRAAKLVAYLEATATDVMAALVSQRA